MGPVGEIQLLPLRAARRGRTLCQGQLLPINQNQALFALLGTTYGRNGRSTFARPDLRAGCPSARTPPIARASKVASASKRCRLPPPLHRRRWQQF